MFQGITLLCMFYIFVMLLIFLVCTNHIIYYKIIRFMADMCIISPPESPLKVKFNIYPKSN